jgi:hypothetical protein
MTFSGTKQVSPVARPSHTDICVLKTDVCQLPENARKVSRQLNDAERHLAEIVFIRIEYEPAKSGRGRKRGDGRKRGTGQILRLTTALWHSLAVRL